MKISIRCYPLILLRNAAVTESKTEMGDSSGSSSDEEDDNDNEKISDLDRKSSSKYIPTEGDYERPPVGRYESEHEKEDEEKKKKHKKEKAKRKHHKQKSSSKEKKSHKRNRRD